MRTMVVSLSMVGEGVSVTTLPETEMGDGTRFLPWRRSLEVLQLVARSDFWQLKNKIKWEDENEETLFDEFYRSCCCRTSTAVRKFPIVMTDDDESDPWSWEDTHYNQLCFNIISHASTKDTNLSDESTPTRGLASANWR
jgi:hypothetical protein